jgi:putative aldouronate transport system substrate-binding protein
MDAAHRLDRDIAGAKGMLERRSLLKAAVGTAGLGLLAACGGGNGGGGSKNAASCVSDLKFPASTAKPQADEIISKVPGTPNAWTAYPKPYKTIPEPPGKGGTVTTFQILFSSPPAPVNSNPWWQELNKRLGVKIQPTLADSPDYPAKLLTLAASGNFPDITYINFNPDGQYGGAGFEKFLAEGAFHDLTPYLTGKGLTQFKNCQLIPAITWKGSAFEGKIYGVPYPIQPVNGQLGMYRKDWAQKLGVDNPKNADQVMDMFVAFSQGDPDGNGKKNTFGVDLLRGSIWAAMFRAPNNWRLNKDGSLVKDMETDEYVAALEFANKMWKKGVFHPDALTLTLNEEESLFESGKTGFFAQGGWGYFGNQPNTIYTLTRQNNKAANPAPWIPPGHDGGKPALPLGSASYGFGAIPSSVKDEKRIVELIHIMEYWAAPFGSDEFTFMHSGIEGKMFHYVDGAPVSVSNGNQNWANGLNYLCAPGEINYFYANQPGMAQTMQKLQEEQITDAVPDPTQGLYSPTWVNNGGTLTKMQTDAYNAIAVGNKPMSYLKEVIQNWKNQGGEKARGEFRDSLEKCK